MKKIILILSLALIIGGLAACGGAQNVAESTEAEKPDTSYSFEGITLTLPEEFNIEEEDPENILFYPQNDGERRTNIGLSLGVADSVSNYSRENIESLFTEKLEGFLGLERYESRRVGESDMIVIGYKTNSDFGVVSQTQALVFLPERSVIVTFTDATADGLYSERFSAVIDSIGIADEVAAPEAPPENG